MFYNWSLHACKVFQNLERKYAKRHEREGKAAERQS